MMDAPCLATISQATPPMVDNEPLKASSGKPVPNAKVDLAKYRTGNLAERIAELEQLTIFHARSCVIICDETRRRVRRCQSDSL